MCIRIISRIITLLDFRLKDIFLVKLKSTYNYANTSKKYQNTSITLNPFATGYYVNREGIFDDSMEDKNEWTTNDPNISFDNATVSHSGIRSLKITNTAGVPERVIHSDVYTKIDNVAPTAYTYSAWVKSDGPEAELFLFMKTENEQGYFSLVDSKATSVVNQWVKIEGTFTVPASIKKLNIRLDNNGTGNVWFDDVKIRKTSNTALADKEIPDSSYADHQLNITYNTFKSPYEIEETGKDKISFVYNDNNDRSVMFYDSLDAKNLRPIRKHYSANGSMEIKQNILTGEIEFVSYIGGNGYSAPVVYKKTFDATGNTQEQILYLHRDYQGSILAITNDTGAILEKRQFDAWGAIIKVQDGAGNILAGLTILDRGYTGHEHLQSVGLIHMNGRLYDPKLHRFLQPDNFVQDPSNTQNYNRYGYVFNNPLKYTDPSGELSLLKKFKNAFKIEMGLFKLDKNRTFGGQLLQILGRFTWESAQTDLGKLYTHINNGIGNVDRVDYFGGATFVTNENSKTRNGITFGNYININIYDKIEGSFENRVLTDQLYMHEYGHTLDSQYWGQFYLPGIGAPSLVSAWTSSAKEHHGYWTEIRANDKASRYFKKHYGINWLGLNTSEDYPTN